MAIQAIILTDKEYEGLRTLCGFGPEKIRSLIHALEGGGEFVKPSKFLQQLKDTFGDAPSATLINELLMGLERRQRRHLVSMAEFLRGVELGLKRKDWDADFLHKWDACRSLLEELMVTKSVVLTSKAVDLSFDFERVYSTSRILTDIRPIFDEERTEIIGAAIIHTLRLQGYASYEYEDESWGLTTEDITHLRDLCDKALRKAELSRKMIESKCNLDVVLAQGDDDGDV